MKINKLLAARGVRIPRGIYVALRLAHEPLPELQVVTTQGDDPLTIISPARLQQLMDDISPHRRSVIELAICGCRLAELILSPDVPRREILQRMGYPQLKALLRMVEHCLYRFGVEGDEPSGQVVSRLMYEVEFVIRVHDDADIEAPSEAARRVKARLLANHVKGMAGDNAGSQAIQ